MRVDLACLEIKHAAAVRVGQSVLAERISAARRERLSPLVERMHRNASASLDAIERAAAAANAASSRGTTTAIAEVGRTILSGFRRSKRPRHIASAAVVVLVLAVVYVSLPDSTPSTGGVLSGVSGPRSPAQPAPPDAGTSPDIRSGATSPSPSTGQEVRVNFDDHRIGPFSAAGWEQPAGVADVAAYPTPFDRSIAVTSTDAGAAETCLTVDGDVGLIALAVDVAVDEAADTVAAVTLRDDTAAPLLTVAVAANGTFVRTDGDILLASGEGVGADAWYTVRVEQSADGLVVQVAPESQGSSPLVSVSLGGPLRLSSVCLGVSGAAGAPAHFDKLRLDYERRSA